LWRPDVAIASEQVFAKQADRAEIVLADGRRLAAHVAGRDPGTNILALRLDTPVDIALPEAAEPALGGLALALGADGGGAPLVRLGIIRSLGPAWHSRAGGHIGLLAFFLEQVDPRRVAHRPHGSAQGVALPAYANVRRMPKLALLQFDTDPARAARREGVASSGMTLVEGEPRWPAFFDLVSRERPDVIVIACAILSQHAREAARYLGDGFNTRDIPVFLVDVPSDEYNETRAAAPRATILDSADLGSALKTAT